jgi:hypothetical protein
MLIWADESIITCLYDIVGVIGDNTPLIVPLFNSILAPSGLAKSLIWQSMVAVLPSSFHRSVQLANPKETS